jgi:hypothetical protein
MIAVIWLELTANLLFITVRGSFITDLQKNAVLDVLCIFPSCLQVQDEGLMITFHQAK